MNAAVLVVMFAACANVEGDGFEPGVDAGIDAAPPAATDPELYAGDQALSPITPQVAANLRAIAERAPTELADDVFAKIGADTSVSANFLHCFDDGFSEPAPDLPPGTHEPGAIDLDGRDSLREVIAHFRDGDAAGSNPYRRASVAATVGMRVADALAPAPDNGGGSLVERELGATGARFAVVALGERDLANGDTGDIGGDIDSFGSDLWTLAEGLVQAGVVPIFTGLAPRADDPLPAAEVTHYNAVIRGIAQAWQVPFIDIYRDLQSAPGLGLGEDGVLLSTYRDSDGAAQACAFTDPALAHGYNLRNLRTVQTLDRVYRTILLGEPAPDVSQYTLHGTGSAADPYIIEQLPFAHMADTTQGTRAVDSYPGCQAAQDESGPELSYRLQLDAPTRVRAMVIDRADADIDVHILAGSADGDACIARAHQMITAELQPGTYYINLDSFVGATGELSGPYLFALTEEPL